MLNQFSENSAYFDDVRFSLLPSARDYQNTVGIPAYFSAFDF
jgi:hypothetical protein